MAKVGSIDQEEYDPYLYFTKFSLKQPKKQTSMHL